jgi:hypothetical protein
LTASHPEVVGIDGEHMYKLDLIKLDPVAYLLILALLAFEVYSTFLRKPDIGDIIERSDAAYQTAVFDRSDNQGILHQIFRQNEINRELLKATLAACNR